MIPRLMERDTEFRTRTGPNDFVTFLISTMFSMGGGTIRGRKLEEVFFLRVTPYIQAENGWAVNGIVCRTEIRGAFPIRCQMLGGGKSLPQGISVGVTLLRDLCGTSGGAPCLASPQVASRMSQVLHARPS